MTIRVAVLDYEAGNVRSAAAGLAAIGVESFITSRVDEARAADALVVPGVGHIRSCLANLRASGLHDLLGEWIADQRPLFGICVGMQLLYEHSDEGDTVGLGLLPGRVERFPTGVVIPHMGWDVVTTAEGWADDPLLDGVAGERCYFVHSYYAVPSDRTHVVATTDYGMLAPPLDGDAAGFPCLVREGSVVGTQFHPEKSGVVGRRLLANWVATLG